jgi:hypothetical protein
MICRRCRVAADSDRLMIRASANSFTIRIVTVSARTRKANTLVSKAEIIKILEKSIA